MKPAKPLPQLFSIRRLKYPKPGQGPRPHFLFKSWILGAVLISANAAWSKGSETHQIKVTLFGESCMLSGPVSESLLTALHSISPERAPASPSAAQIKALLIREKSLPALPDSLDTYRERLVKRLKAQASFFEGLSAAKKAKSATPLISATQSYLMGRRKDEFEALARGFFAPVAAATPKIEKIALKSKPLKMIRDEEQLFDDFNDRIDLFPEEEFHRSIRRMDIHYDCSFEEGESEE